MPDSPSAIMSSLEGLPARAVLEALARLHQAVFAADENGVAWVSEELGRLRGGAAASVSGDASWRTVAPGDGYADYFPDRSQLAEIRRRYQAEGRVHGARMDLLGCDGRMVPIEIDVVGVPAVDAKRPLFVGIVRPLEALEERQRRLRETAELLSGILDSSPTAVLAVDERGFITYANAAVQGLLGRSREEIVEKPLAMLAASPEQLATAIDGSGHGEEIELHHADGSPRLVSVAASPLRIANAPARGSVVMLHDHSQRRRDEDGLRRKNAELEHYVQNVTHDLRSPLVSLLGFSRLLHQEYGESMDDTARHFLDRIEKAGHAMEALINDLLELSRIGGSHDHKAYVNVSDVLLQIQAELKPRLESQNVRLALPGEPLVVLCDRTRLYQVFSNLIGNALDYMGPVDDPFITIEVFEEPEEHRIVVRDNGRGIAPAQRERIFELFQSGGQRADGRRGTGIGLAIVKKIAQSQGGRVWVESRQGEGAAFHVTLPRG